MKNRTHLFVACFFFLTGLIVYSNSLHSPFMVDDHAFFDERMKNIKFLKYQFLPDRDRALGIGGGNVDVYYRPLALVIPMLCKLVFGENTFGFHFFNLILFCLAALGIYMFVSAVFKNRWLGFLTGLFYLVHPINGIIVNFITASVFPGQVIFMLASLRFLLGVPLRAKVVSKVLSVFFFALALMCHETAMALPLYALCLLVFVERLSWKDAIKKCVPLLVFLFFYFLFRLKYASLNNSIFDQIGHFHISFWQYLGTFAKIICWYLGQLIYPNGIVMIWCTPIITQGVGWWVFVFFIMIMGYITGLVFYRHQKSASMGLIWFGLGFAPLTLACLFQPTQGLVIEPHWFVFPSIGFFLFLASVLVSLPSLRGAIATKQTLLLSLFLIIPWCIVSHVYNHIWSDEERYCLFWVEKAPHFKGGKFFLARTYLAEGKLEKAKYYYQSCISHMYVDHLFYANLGLIEYLEGDWQGAKSYYAEALAIEPRLEAVWINLGDMAIKENNLSLAKDDFAKAIASNRFSESPRLNMARLMEKEGDMQGAIQMYRSILDIIPHDETVLISLLKIYFEKKDRDHTIEIARELAAYSHRPLTQHNVGIIFQSLGLQDDADRAFERAGQL